MAAQGRRGAYRGLACGRGWSREGVRWRLVLEDTVKLMQGLLRKAYGV